MTLPKHAKPIPIALVGANSPSVRPGNDDTIYGTAVLEAPEIVEVRTYQTFQIRYRVGRLGLDDTGAIRIAFRLITDAGKPQATDPTAPNYVSAKCSGEGQMRLRIGPEGPRPWILTVTAQLNGGYLNAGEEILVTFGDTSAGSPGMLMQTFVEEGYELRVMTDVQATGNFLPLKTQYAIGVHPGPGENWFAVLPTLRQVGEPFRLGLKCEDRWGNPTNQASGKLRIETTMPVEGLPDVFDYQPDDRTMIFDNLKANQPGELRLKLYEGDDLVAEAGPLVIGEETISGYWGDLHGQTGETIGVNSIESYFDFARNKAFLDVCAHQANDFQINAAFWQKINDMTASVYEPGKFTVFPGYEWSGNTAIGGDHNVFYAEEGRPIYRCSHALLEDRAEMENDANTLTDLYEKLQDEDATVYAHVGGRYCNIYYDHNPNIETAVEMHSAWGTFEWVLTDGFPMRRRVGVVCNSDGHKGRPGASYPGASRFGAYGGLTCFLTDRNDRKAIMEAQRRRHHFGTTGCRIHMDVKAVFKNDAKLFLRNPDGKPDSETENTRQAMMGDIVQVQDELAELKLDIRASVGIHRVEVRSGTDVVKEIRAYDETDVQDRIRVCWSGAEYRGRGRDVAWQGRAQFDTARITSLKGFNMWNPETVFEQRGSQSLIWRGVTTGNFMGFDAILTDSRNGTLDIKTSQGSMGLHLDDIGYQRQYRELGGLGKAISVERMPNTPLAREIQAEVKVPIALEGDTQIWICVTLEDGHQAWSSPIYLFRDSS